MFVVFVVVAGEGRHIANMEDGGIGQSNDGSVVCKAHAIKKDKELESNMR